MKNLVIYYSRSGTNKKLAEEITKRLKADQEEIVDLTNRKSFLKTLFVGGFQALKKSEIPIAPVKADLSQYDRVIVCSPTWAGSLPPATRTFLSGNAKNIKKLAYISVCGAGKGNEPKVVPQIKEAINKDFHYLFLKRIDFINGIATSQLSEFLKTP